MLSQKELILLSLSKLKGVGNMSLRQVFSDIDAGLNIDELSEIYPKIKKGIAATPNYKDIAEKDIEACIAQDVSILSAFDQQFPKGMKNNLKGPLFIYTKGDIGLLSQSALGIIGTRNPDIVAREYAKRVSTHFATLQVPILSGLAKGCDSIAHETSLDCGGSTIGVLGHGLHKLSQADNGILGARIVSSKGLLISQFPMGVEPSKFTFVERDITQAALSQAVILVQSNVDGGSLHACRWIITMGRTLFVLPPTDHASEDANAVIYNRPDLITNMLECKEPDLQRVIRLKSKYDYNLVIQALQ